MSKHSGFCCSKRWRMWWWWCQPELFKAGTAPVTQVIATTTISIPTLRPDALRVAQPTVSKWQVYWNGTLVPFQYTLPNLWNEIPNWYHQSYPNQSHSHSLPLTQAGSSPLLSPFTRCSKCFCTTNLSYRRLLAPASRILGSFFAFLMLGSFPL